MAAGRPTIRIRGLSVLRSASLNSGREFGEDQILIWGDIEDLRAAADGFRRWASQPLPGSVSGLPAEIRLVEGAPPNGMTRDGQRLAWSLSRSDAERFARLAEALANSGKPGHHYLDIDGPKSFGLTVKLSRGEYPPDFPLCEAGAK